jgi:hypothetical protein
MDESAIATETPNIGELIKSFRQAGTTDNYVGRLRAADETRFCIWDGQSDDGKKNQENFEAKVFPWDGASDTRVFQADEVCGENASSLQVAFWRATLQMGGTKPGAASVAGAATTFLDWLRAGKLMAQLDAEVEFSAQWGETYGWCGIGVTWEREIGLRMQPVELAPLQELATQVAQNPGAVPAEQRPMVSVLALYPALVLDPAMEEQAIEATRFLYRAYVRQAVPESMIADAEIPKLSTKRARAVVKSLRETSKAEIPVPYVCKNQPCFSALKPWRDIVVPDGTTDIQKARMVFVRQFLTETELRTEGLADGWAEGFITAAAGTAGKASVWTGNYDAQTTSSNTSVRWQAKDQKTGLIEIVWGYQKQVDEDGFSGVYVTVFSPHLGEDASQAVPYGKHALLDYPHAEYPVVVYRTERPDRLLTSTRGTPEILLTSQREEKVQRDSIIDLTSLAVVPPLNVPSGTLAGKYVFGPAQQNEVKIGREPAVMEVPTAQARLAFETIEMIDRKKARRFGQFHETVPPALSQVIQEPKVRKFLTAWAEAFKQAWELAKKFAPELVVKVTGVPLEMLQASGDVDLVMHFDIAQLNPDLMVQKAEAFSKMLPEDAAGVIDRTKFVELKARMIDPVWAKELIQDKGAASQQMFKEVADNMMWMHQGNAPMLADASNDASAATKLQFAQQILMGNPRYLQALDPAVLGELMGGEVPPQLQMMLGQGQGADPLFSKHLMDFLKNLQMGAMQQENKTVGRLGVRQNGGNG